LSICSIDLILSDNIINIKIKDISMIQPSKALELVFDNIQTIGNSRICLNEGIGRIAAENPIAGRSLPAKNNAAMDGYAVRHEDIKNAPVKLEVTGTIKAGDDESGFKVEKGKCVKIMTGAYIPEGADTIIEWEKSDCGAETVEVKEANKKGAHIRLAGEDVQKGEKINVSGRIITPEVNTRLLSAGVFNLDVFRKPNVAIIPTGNELAEAFTVSSEEKVVDSNSRFIKDLLDSKGFQSTILGIAKDDDDSLINLMKEAVNYDLIVTTGGISEGEYDVVKNLSDEIGIKQIFHNIAQKPGKPMTFGLLKDKPIFNIPGNPVSSIFCTYFYILPALRKMSGRTNYKHVETEAFLGKEVNLKHRKRTAFDRAWVEINDEGKLICTPVLKQDSHIIDNILETNSFAIFTPEMGGKHEKGDKVKVVIFDYESIFVR